MKKFKVEPKPKNLDLKSKVESKQFLNWNLVISVTPETAWSESSRNPETQKLHGLKAAETQNFYHPSQFENY